MKRNAIIRIVIWSIAIVLLLSVMFSVMFGVNWKRVSLTEESMAAVPITEPTEVGELVFSEGSASVTATVNIRRSPSTESEAVGMLNAGDSILITRQETVNGFDWAYITAPKTGWVLMEYVQTDPYIQETMVSSNYATEGDIALDAGKVQNLEIEWVAGSILIQPIDTDQILFSEDGVSDDRYSMVWKQRGDSLSISFCDDAIMDFGFGISMGAELSKDLTIYVPLDWSCNSLEIEAASATVEVNDLTIQNVEFDGASGTCEFENCQVDKIDLDTASGDIRFIGSLNILDCDAASASVYAVLDNIPTRMDLDSMSGDLDITLPEDAGFTVTMDGLSNDFRSDFETTIKNNNHVHGDGSCRINVDAMSGDVTIRMGEASTES